MTLGEKIRKYRILRKKTQKQLGEEVGFKSNTADVRINQYESNKMAPKSAIRSNISNALDIDIEAISDVNISSFEDLMFVLFELEEKYGIEIEKKDNKTYIVFDDNNKDIETLISYLNIWNNHKNNYLPSNTASSSEQLDKYNLWKARFVTNIKEFYHSKAKELDDFYNPLLNSETNKEPYFQKVGELISLLVDFFDSGTYISVTYHLSALEITFAVSELQTATKTVQSMFIRFLKEYNHYISLGVPCSIDMQMKNKQLTITYCIPIPSFSIVSSSFNEYIDFKNNNENNDELSIEMFNKSFQITLDEPLYIEEEIKRYYKV